MKSYILRKHVINSYIPETVRISNTFRYYHSSYGTDTEIKYVTVFYGRDIPENRLKRFSTKRITPLKKEEIKIQSLVSW